MLVSDMAVNDRPAVRAKNLGIKALTNVELLVLAMGLSDTLPAETLLAQAGGSLRRLAATLDRIEAKGIGEGKKLVLVAAVELGIRSATEAHEETPKIRTPLDVFVLCSHRMSGLEVEEFRVLILNSQHELQRDVLVTRGILNSSLVHPREVYKIAIVERAAAIILVHNHPSGDPTPSSDDRNITPQLVQAGRLLDIPVHDHVIIGKSKYASFAEAGLL